MTIKSASTLGNQTCSLIAVEGSKPRHNKQTTESSCLHSLCSCLNKDKIDWGGATKQVQESC